MVKINISLNTINSVKDFVNTVNKYNFDVDLHSARYTVDAKSIMGIFSLDLAKPIELIADCSEEEAAMLKEDMKAFLA